MNREEELRLFRRTIRLISPIKNNLINHFNIKEETNFAVEQVAKLNQEQGKETLKAYIEKEGVRYFGKRS